MSMFSFFVCVCSAPVTSIDLSSKSILASCGMDRFVYFVDTRVSSFVYLFNQTQQVVRSYRSPNLINDLSFSVNGEKLALATIDSQVYIMDLRV